MRQSSTTTCTDARAHKAAGAERAPRRGQQARPGGDRIARRKVLVIDLVPNPAHRTQHHAGSRYVKECASTPTNRDKYMPCCLSARRCCIIAHRATTRLCMDIVMLAFRSTAQEKASRHTRLCWRSVRAAERLCSAHHKVASVATSDRACACIWDRARACAEWRMVRTCMAEKTRPCALLIPEGILSARERAPDPATPRGAREAGAMLNHKTVAGGQLDTRIPAHKTLRADTAPPCQRVGTFPADGRLPSRSCKLRGYHGHRRACEHRRSGGLLRPHGLRRPCGLWRSHALRRSQSATL